MPDESSSGKGTQLGHMLACTREPLWTTAKPNPKALSKWFWRRSKTVFPGSVRMSHLRARKPWTN